MHEFVAGDAYLPDHPSDRIGVPVHLQLREEVFIREDILALAHVHVIDAFERFSCMFLHDFFYVSLGQFRARQLLFL